MRLLIAMFVGIGCAGIAAAQEAPQAEVLFLQGQLGAVSQRCPAESLPSRLLPEEETACVLSVRSLLQQRDFTAARERVAVLQHIRGSAEWRTALQLTVADSYYIEGNWIAASQAYQTAAEFAKSTPLRPLALYGQARALQYLGDLPKAREFLTEVIRFAPWSFEAESAREILNDDAYLAVQVGSFQDRSNAVKLLKDLQRQGYTATLSETLAPSQMHVRVRVGRFASYAEARQMQDELDRLGYPTRIAP